MVAHERPTEPGVTMERLLAKPRSFANLPAFLDLNGTSYFRHGKTKIIILYDKLMVIKINKNFKTQS